MRPAEAHTISCDDLERLLQIAARPPRWPADWEVEPGVVHRDPQVPYLSPDERRDIERIAREHGIRL